MGRGVCDRPWFRRLELSPWGRDGRRGGMVGRLRRARSRETDSSHPSDGHLPVLADRHTNLLDRVSGIRGLGLTVLHAVGLILVYLATFFVTVVSIYGLHAYASQP